MPEILSRQLSLLNFGKAWAFEAIRNPDNPAKLSVFLHLPHHRRPLHTAPFSPSQTDIRLLPYAAMIALREATPDGPVAFDIEGVSHLLPTTHANWDLFAGKRVMVGQRNDEPVAAVLDWLSWHACHHGVEAALLLDRGDPAATAAFGKALSEALSEMPDCRGLAQLVLVGTDQPLGIAEEGPENNPFYAPDAPGKDRMTAPDPAPWQSRLGFSALYSLLADRYLGAAAAVLHLDVMDLLMPDNEGRTVFDALDCCPSGYLSLSGQRCFPWGLSPKAASTLHWDHICTRFDQNAVVRSWCVAPPRLPKDAIWMPHRILKAAVGGEWPAPFWRCMSLRYGNKKVSRIVPRTSLQEEPALMALSEAQGHRPRRMPDSAEAGGMLPTREAQGNRTAIVTTMKNEGPFILEWLAYHRAIGVDDVLVYTNDCSDGTESFLQLLDAKGYVNWRDNPYRSVDMKPQHAALEAANTDPVIAQADWVICMDVDEYIAIHIGDGRLPALFHAVPDANLISLTWRLFGNADVHEFRDEFITQRFTLAAQEFANKPHQAWGFKTLFRNMGLFRKLGVHRPKGLRPHAHKKITWVNGSGQNLPVTEWRTAWRSTSETYGYDLVSLNHYAVRSAESFLVKRDRGRVNHVDRDQGTAYWFRMNHNVVHDDRMQRLFPLLKAEYDRLMSDPEIAQAHHAAVAAHRAKIDELKTQPNYSAFYEELTGPRLEKLSRLHGHFGANVYLAGPARVPDEIIAKNPEEDFFFTVDFDGETQH